MVYRSYLGVGRMSAGNLLGTVFVGIMFSAMWIIIGAMIEKVGIVFNHYILLVPSFQDAVNGFQLTQVIFTVIPIIVWIALWVNYAQNEASESGGYV
jgi:hypothetical protein